MVDAPRLPFVWQAQYTESLGGPGGRWAAGGRVGAAGPRLSFVWAGGRRWAVVAFRVAGAVHRGFRAFRRSTQSSGTSEETYIKLTYKRS